MEAAARQILWGKAPSNFSDWSLETALSLRKQYAASLPKFSTMPTTVGSTTMPNIPVLVGTTKVVMLSDYAEKFGIFYKSNQSDTYFKYSIFDYETMTYQNTSLQIPCNSSDALACCINIDGILIVAIRSAKKIYVVKQDGSDMSLIAPFSASFSSNRTIRLYSNYDGTCLLFGEDTTGGPSIIISRDLQITNGPTMNSTYPYSYIKLLGYAAIAGSTGVLSLFNENMTTKLIDNRSIGSYSQCYRGFYVPPKDDEIMYGEDCRSVNIGVNYKTLANVTSSQPSFYINGCRQACFMPNGQLFYNRDMQDSTHTFKYTLYDYINDQHLDIDPADGTKYVKLLLMSTGRIAALYDYNNILTFKLFDYGISKSYTPANLCFGPFGYNGSFKIQDW